MTLLDGTHLLLGAAAGCSAACARVDRQMRPVAIFLALVLAASLVRALLQTDAPGPYLGVARALFHLREALFLVSAAGLAWLCSVSLAGLPARGAALVCACTWVAAVCGLAVAYPWARGEILRRLYLVGELVTVILVGVPCVVASARRRVASLPVVCVWLLLAVEAAVLLAGPWARGLYGAWQLAQAAYCVMYAALIVLQGGVLWLRMTRCGS